MKIALRAKFVKTFLIIIAFSLFFQSLLRVDALSTNVFDLGIFSTNLFNINNEVERSFYVHVQPLMIPWGLVFDALPSNIATFVLVGFQTFTILVSIFWIFRVFGIWAAASPALSDRVPSSRDSIGLTRRSANSIEPKIASNNAKRTTKARVKI